MSVFSRILIIIVTAALLASCAAPATTANPRAMSFAPLSYQIPNSERATLPNGMVVYMLPDHELPIINMTAYIRTGGIYEPAEAAGLASLTGEAMRSGGTLQMPAEKLDAELEFMASSIETGIGAEYGTASMVTLTKNLERTLELFAQVLMTPAFEEERVRVAVNHAIESLRRQNDNPKSVADRELRKALYAGHPLGRYPTVATVSTLGRDQMLAFHRRYFQPNAVILAVAGDFQPDELIARLTAVFEPWQKGPLALPPVADPVSPARHETLFVRKELNQSVVRMGELGIEKNNPDLYALRVMDYILGGGFTSRLTQEIRSNQGLAYNVDSNIDVGRLFIGSITAETETKSGSTIKAITLMRDIIAGMTAAPVSEQELSLARDYMINSFMFGFTKPEVIVNQRARLEFFGYPEGYLENYRSNIAMVSRDDVLRVARRYLHPEKMTLVVVGDERHFEKPLATFGPLREIILENGK